MYYRHIVAITLGVFCGTLIAFTVNFSSEIFLVSLFLLLVNFSIYKLKVSTINKNSRVFSLMCATVFFGVSFGIVIGQISIYKDIVKSQKFDTFINKNKIINGKIKELKQRQNSQEIILNIKNETDETFNVKVIINNISYYKLGETISVEGKIATSTILLPNINKNNKSIDLKNINNLSDVDGEMFFPKIKILQDVEGESFISKIQNFKRHFVLSLERSSSVKGAALGSGTLIGDSSLFTSDETNDFRLSGLSHIIVVSGFNVTIIIFVLIFLFSFLNIRLGFRIFLLIISILLFIGFIGFSSSVVRAGLMAIALLLSYMFGRRYVAKQTLFLISLFMIICNPKISAFDISFHLSFLATFAILFLYPNLKYLFRLDLVKYKIKNTFIKNIFTSLYEIFLITLSIQIITLPYVSFIFGYISPFGIFANILVLPILPIVMFLGFMTFLFSFSFFLSTIFGLTLSLFSKYIFSIAEYFASFSFAKLEIDFSFLFLIFYYLLVIIFLYFENKRKDIKKYLDQN